MPGLPPLLLTITTMPTLFWLVYLQFDLRVALLPVMQSSSSAALRTTPDLQVFCSNLSEFFDCGAGFFS